MERDLLRQRLVRSLNIIALLLLDHCIDFHAADQHHKHKQQVHAQQLHQERSTHITQHGNTPR